MIFLDSVAFNMSYMVHQHSYGSINIDEPVSEGLYVVRLTSITYKLHDSIEVSSDTRTEVTFVYYKKHMSPA